MRDANNKVAFITGGGSGIGLGMVKTFLDAGLKVMVADQSIDNIQDAATQIGAHPQVRYAVVDVTDRAALAAAAADIVRAFGKVQRSPSIRRASLPYAAFPLAATT
jgi:NADP-dependent 3-hydroxy acid dehydrogenase YdfG